MRRRDGNFDMGRNSKSMAMTDKFLELIRLDYSVEELSSFIFVHIFVYIICFCIISFLKLDIKSESMRRSSNMYRGNLLRRTYFGYLCVFFVIFVSCCCDSYFFYIYYLNLD